MGFLLVVKDIFRFDSPYSKNEMERKVFMFQLLMKKICLWWWYKNEVNGLLVLDPMSSVWLMMNEFHYCYFGFYPLVLNEENNSICATGSIKENGNMKSKLKYDVPKRNNYSDCDTVQPFARLFSLLLFIAKLANIFSVKNIRLEYHSPRMGFGFRILDFIFSIISVIIQKAWDLKVQNINSKVHF